MALVYNNAERNKNFDMVTVANSGTYDGTAFAVAESVTGPDTAIAYATAQAAHGVQSFRFPTQAYSTSSPAHLGLNSVDGNANGTMRFYVYLTGYGTNTTWGHIPLANFTWSSAPNGIGHWGVGVSNDGKLIVNKSNELVYPIKATGAGATVPLNTWVRIEMRYNSDNNGVYSARWYLGDGTAAQDSVSGNTGENVGGFPNYVTYGKGEAVAISGIPDFYLDNLANDTGIYDIGPASSLTENSLEGGVDNTVVTTANSGGLSGDAFTGTVGSTEFPSSSVKYSSAQTYTGGMALSVFPGFLQSVRLSEPLPQGSTGEVATRGYFFFPASPTNTDLEFFSLMSGAVRVMTFTYATVTSGFTQGAFVLRAGSTSAAFLGGMGAGTAAAYNNQWLRFEMYVNQLSNAWSAAIYIGESTTPIYSASGTSISVLPVAEPINTVGVGRFNNNGTNDMPVYYADGLALNTGASGFIGIPAVATTPVAQNLSTFWNTRAAVSVSTISDYRVSTLASEARASAWAVRTSISTGVSSTWNVAPPIYTVTRTVSDSFSVRQVVLRSAPTSFAVKARTLSRTANETWYARAALSQKASDAFGVRTSAPAATQTTAWDISAPSLLVENSANGGTNLETVTTANSGGLSGTAFSSVETGIGGLTFTNEATHRESLIAYRVNGGDTLRQGGTLSNGISDTKTVTRGYFYFPAAPTATNYFMTVTAGTALTSAAFITTDGSLGVLFNDGGASTVSAANIPLNTWVRVELATDTAAGTATASVALDNNNGFYGTVVDTGVASNAQVTGGFFGRYIAATNTLFYFDDIAFKTGNLEVIGVTGGSVERMAPTTWNVGSTVSASRDESFGVRTSLGSSLSTLWAARTAVSGLKASNYGVRSILLGTPRGTEWNVFTSVAPASGSSSYDVRESLQAGRVDINWDIRALTSPTLTSTGWGVRSYSPVAAQSTLWGVRNFAPVSAKSTLWNIFTGTPNSTQTTLWNVKARVQADRTTRWRIVGELIIIKAGRFTSASTSTQASLGETSSTTQLGGSGTSVTGLPYELQGAE